MKQIQRMWFAIDDSNTQKYVENIFKADEKDFIKATNRVYRSMLNASLVCVGVLD